MLLANTRRLYDVAGRRFPMLIENIRALILTLFALDQESAEQIQ